MNNRLKIVHLTASLNIGGAERIILSMAEKMDRARFETHVCALGEFDENSFLPEFQKLGSALQVIPVRHFYSPSTLWDTIRYLRHHKFDVIHTHLTDADIIGRIAGWLTNTPVVSTMHSTPSNYNKQQIDRRWLLRATNRLVPSYLVGVSEEVRNLFIKEWRIPPERISAIPNATPLDNFLAIPVGTDSETANTLTVTNVGSLRWQKGQHFLLEAAQIILKQRPNTRFVIAGGGPLEQELKMQAQALGITDQVIFAGLVRDIPALLEKADIFVLSSVREGLPISAIEAMAAARPSVLTDVGGNKELFESGVGGFIVPSRDVPALADALLLLLNDESLRLTMGRNARQKAQEKFSFDVFTQAYGDIYQSVVADAKDGR